MTTIEDGTLIEVTERSICGDEQIDGQAGRVGHKYSIYTYSAEGEGDDPEGKAYYLLDDENSCGGGYWAYPGHVKVISTPKELAARKAPTVEEIAKIVSSTIHSAFGAGGIEFNETEVCEEDGQYHVLAYGRTFEELPFAAKIKIEETWRVDF